MVYRHFIFELGKHFALLITYSFSIQLVDPNATISPSPSSKVDPRSLMTMVEIPSRSRQSSSPPAPISSASYYSPSGRDRSPHRAISPSSPGSPPTIHSRYDDSNALPIVDPDMLIVKPEHDSEMAVVSSLNFFIYSQILILRVIFRVIEYYS